LNKVFAALILLLATLAVACTPTFEERVGLDYKRESIEKGRKLVRGLAACGYCHGTHRSPDANLSGGREFRDRYGSVIASNLTPSISGLGQWTLGDFSKSLRANLSPTGNYISKPLHSGYQWLSDADLNSIFAYLVSEEPILNQLPKRRVGAFKRSTIGMLEGEIQVRGFVPEIRSDNKYEYGSYLTNHVARCGVCHDGDIKIFSSADTLVGGRDMSYFGAGGVTAPPLVGVNFKRRYNQQKLKDYLFGTKKVSTQLTKKVCPVDFYQNASAEQIEALTFYILKQ
jgi:hypothetical protein